MGHCQSILSSITGLIILATSDRIIRHSPGYFDIITPMKINFEILAKIVPALLIALGFMNIYLFGFSWGWLLIFLGFFLLIFYFLTRIGRK